MDKEALRNYLLDNIDVVEEFLNIAGFYGVKYYECSEQWRMGIDEDSSTSSIRLSSKDLSYKDFKFSDSGDIFSLVMIKKSLNFPSALQYVASKTKFIETDYKEVKCELPYYGYYKTFKKDTDSRDLEIYSHNLIEEYPKTISKLFLSDNISIETQEVFNIRYCSDSHRVIIPCYEEGNLIGAIGRYNLKEVPKDVPKYLPIIRYNKSQYVFGINENYIHLKNNTIYIVESEKTVLTCHSLGIYNVVAIGGNSVSKFHKNKILKLIPTEIILILDKGLGEDKAKYLNINLKEELDKYLKSVIISEASKLLNKICKVNILDCNLLDEIPNKENIFDINSDKEYILSVIESKKEEIDG